MYKFFFTIFFKNVPGVLKLKQIFVFWEGADFGVFGVASRPTWGSGWVGK